MDMEQILSFPPRHSRPGEAVIMDGTVVETDGRGGLVAVRLADGTVLRRVLPRVLQEPPVAEGDGVVVAWTRGRYLLVCRHAGAPRRGDVLRPSFPTIHTAEGIMLHLGNATVYVGAGGVVEIDGRAIQDDPRRLLLPCHEQRPAPR